MAPPHRWATPRASITVTVSFRLTSAATVRGADTNRGAVTVTPGLLCRILNKRHWPYSSLPSAKVRASAITPVLNTNDTSAWTKTERRKRFDEISTSEV